MVRTKVDSGRSYRKVLVSRAPRKALRGSSGVNAGPSPAAKRGERVPAGAAPLNPVCVRPVPAWQKGISEFLQRARSESRQPDGEQAASSGLRPAAKSFPRRAERSRDSGEAEPRSRPRCPLLLPSRAPPAPLPLPSAAPLRRSPAAARRRLASLPPSNGTRLPGWGRARGAPEVAVGGAGARRP
ncbi:PCNA-associated factor [Dryobates pubescens]|uniref:PCNA-associated factor n=1 Tax=Dryobates pubescens TaxID=118200 RepID=UPI0023B92A2D|nr:PCNA-associated factor [Dryobates pubescens]